MTALFLTGITPDRRRQLALVGIVALVAALAVLVAESGAPRDVNDYFKEAAPSYLALAHGHLLLFVQLAPLYGGSLALRAPFAMVPTLWGGGAGAMYVASAVPSMIALAAFATWAAAQPRRIGATWLADLVVIAACVLTPYVTLGVRSGHPEDLLGAVLCVAAVLAAVNGRTRWAGLLIAVAVVNKPWAAVAVPVVIAALPSGRLRASAMVAAIAALALVPLIAIRPDFIVGSARSIGSMFLPPQLLWWVGKHSWVAQWAHVEIVVVAAAAVIVWYWLRRRRGALGAPTAQEALLLLAFVLMLRAALDPWNNVYYAIPFLFALLAYEVCSGRPPFLMLACSVLLWIAPQIPRTAISADMRALVYAAIAVPILAALAGRLYAPRATSRLPIRARPGPKPESSGQLALARGRAHA